MSTAVLHILPESEPYSEYRGGAISRWVANVIRDDESGMVLCPDSDGSWPTPTTAIRIVAHLDHYARFRNISYKIGWGVRRLILRRILRPALELLRPGDVVWVHNRPDLAAAIRPLVHAARAKLVVHMHNSFLAQRSRRRVQEINADHYVFVSRFLESEAVGTHRDLSNTSVVYNGADHSIFYPSAERNDTVTPAVVLFASRLVPDKGAHILVAAMRELYEGNVPARAILVGASSFGGSKDTEYIRSLRRDAPPNVSFRPYCAGAALGDLFRRADIFCAPSIWQDPFPLAPLEAMASGLPVVATKSGGIPEALREGGGIIVERNSVRNLTDALHTLICDRPLRRSLARDAEQSFRRNFTWASVQRQYKAVVESMN